MAVMYKNYNHVLDPRMSSSDEFHHHHVVVVFSKTDCSVGVPMFQSYPLKKKRTERNQNDIDDGIIYCLCCCFCNTYIAFCVSSTTKYFFESYVYY